MRHAHVGQLVPRTTTRETGFTRETHCSMRPSPRLFRIASAVFLSLKVPWVTGRRSIMTAHLAGGVTKMNKAAREPEVTTSPLEQWPEVTTYRPAAPVDALLDDARQGPSFGSSLQLEVARLWSDGRSDGPEGEAGRSTKYSIPPARTYGRESPYRPTSLFCGPSYSLPASLGPSSGSHVKAFD